MRISRPLAALAIGLFGWLLIAVLVPQGSDAQLLAVARAVIGSTIAITAVVVLLLRVRATTTEREMWRPCAMAGTALAFAVVGQSVYALVGRSAEPPHVGWAAAFAAPPVLLAGAAIYRGLVSWNRFRTSVSNPADWLNGLSGVFAMVAIANLVTQAGGFSFTHWDSTAQQAWLLSTAAFATALGTLPTVTSLAVLARDPRVWLLGLGLVAAVSGQVASLFHGLPPFRIGSWAETGWLVLLCTLAWAATLPRAGTRTQPSTTLATMIGTMVVLGCSIAVLALMAESDIDNRVASSFALAACIGAGAQGGRIIRELEGLAQSRREARTDDLTGTANRRELLDQLKTLVGQRVPVAVLMIDLDRFKEINDQYGHSVGDQLLQRMAHRILRHIPADAVMARLGGDEFAVLLSGRSSQTADQVGQRLLRAISELARIDDKPMKVGVSIGVSILADPGAQAGCPDSEVAMNETELLRRADVAMYAAKRAGGGLRTYSKALDSQLRQRAESASQLRALLTTDAPATDLGRIVTVFQPQISAVTGRTVGLEALVRWDHPSQGWLTPDRFLDIVEEQDLMMALTSTVLRQATGFAAELQDRALPSRISVNVSASSLADPDLETVILAALRESGLQAQALTVEITETAFMSDPEKGLVAVSRLASHGMGISIDDYGTGYSSLAYLDALAASELKLDRSLVSRVIGSPRTAGIVASTIELAHKLGLGVVAEGVEDQATHDALRAIGCDEMQGFLYASPLSREQCLVRLTPVTGSAPVRVPPPRTASGPPSAIEAGTPPWTHES